MPTTLYSDLNTYHPLSMCKVPTGENFIANGLDAPLRYDGVSATAETAGMEVPGSAPTLADGGAGALTGTYYGYVRFIDDEGIPSNLSPISSGLTITSKDIDWSGIPVSSDPRTVSRQLFRNTTGQTSTFYLVTTITDNVTTTYSADNTADADLAENESLRILAPDGSVFANRFTPPPAKAVVAYHGRNTFWAVDPVYDKGHILVTNGSSAITGYGTQFTEAMVGRVLHVVGEDTTYTIATYNSPTSLSLVGSYSGTTDRFAYYAIKADKSERGRIYFSYPEEPESVPELSNSVVPQSGEDEDEPVGLMSFNSMLYVLMERSIYRWTFQINPDVDGALYLNANRGCINNRCWCRVDGMAFLMDRQGIYVFTGGAPDPISADIQDYFRPGGINWTHHKWFSAAAYPGKETVKFFVCLDGSLRPRHALCYNYRRGGWWIEEYPWMVGSSGQSRVNEQIRLLIGGEHENIWLTEETKTYDGPVTSKVLRATVDSATPLSVTASTLDFDADEIETACVEIVAGRGKHQRRRILVGDPDTGRLDIDRPWLVTPDSTSVLQVGGIRWVWQSSTFELIPEVDRREYQVSFSTTKNDCSFDIRTYLNNETVPVNQTITMACGGYPSPGVSTEQDSPDVNVITNRRQGYGYAVGYEWWRLSANMDQRGPTDRYLSMELAGVTSGEALSLYAVTIVGVAR